MNENKERTLKAEVVQVFSADDLIVLVDLGVEDLFKKQRVRLHGVDAPNAVRSGPETTAGKLRSYVKSLCKGRTLKLEIKSRGVSSWVVVAWIIDDAGLEKNLNEDLMAQGFAYKRENSA